MYLIFFLVPFFPLRLYTCVPVVNFIIWIVKLRTSETELLTGTENSESTAGCPQRVMGLWVGFLEDRVEVLLEG